MGRRQHTPEQIITALRDSFIGRTRCTFHRVPHGWDLTSRLSRSTHAQLWEEENNFSPDPNRRRQRRVSADVGLGLMSRFGDLTCLAPAA